MQVRDRFWIPPPQVAEQVLHPSQSDHRPSTGQGSSLHERVATPLPSQSFPPLAGGGLEQVLLRLCIPPPHVTGHFSQAFQSVQFPSTSHGISLQGRISSLSPEQSSPPKAGGGLSQFLKRLCKPPPHVTEQVSHSLHCDQLPCTGHLFWVRSVTRSLSCSKFSAKNTSLPEEANVHRSNKLVFLPIPSDKTLTFLSLRG